MDWHGHDEGHAHGHSHGIGLGGDEEWDEAPLPVKQLLTGAIVVVLLATVIGLVVWWPRGEANIKTEVFDFTNARVKASVVTSDRGPCSYEPESECAQITAEVTSGDATGDTAQLEFNSDGEVPAASLEAGDKILLDDAGPDAPPENRYSFADFQRGAPMLILGVLFAVAVVVLGRFRGLFALLGLALSIGVLVWFIMPALLRGSSPVGVALTGASVIALGALYLAHGFNERTTVAVLGTMSSLLLTGLLAWIFAGAAHLTGLATEESLSLLAYAPGLDFRGLMLAAVIIGALGVLDDVTVTQVSAVGEIHRSNPDLPSSQLYSAGIRIGRDHIASTVNTLFLAYSAAALPLLLIFTQSGLGAVDVVTSEAVAVEIVQTLVGSIGLVASVPITTALAAWVVTRGSAGK